MHLMELLRLRSAPAAGVFLSLTRRCPLLCDHCSTNSTMVSEEHEEAIFRRFVQSFTTEDHPELLLLTGGEPLLRPALVQELTELAHAVGTRVYLLSGAYYARERAIPAPITRAIAGVDHFCVSLDQFHERQVPRASTLRVIGAALERGQDVSIQVIGRDADDPYLADVSADIRRTFADRVPVLVGRLMPSGRGRPPTPPTLIASARLPQDTYSPAGPEPCAMASWPVVSFDGTVVGCCNQDVVNGPAPAHLRLGHAMTESWADVRRRALGEPTLRAVRLYGPNYVAERFGAKLGSCDGYCATCFRLGDDATLAADLDGAMARPAVALVEQQVLTMHQQTPLRSAIAEYAHLAMLGQQPERAAALCAV